MITACYHARTDFLRRQAPRFGERVKIIAATMYNGRPRHTLIEFGDGTRIVTNYGCLRFDCRKHEKRL